MRISDWSSDVCSSDLQPDHHDRRLGQERDPDRRIRRGAGTVGDERLRRGDGGGPAASPPDPDDLARLRVRRAATGGLDRRGRGRPGSSEQRRVGEEGGSNGKTRWWPVHSKKKKKT